MAKTVYVLNGPNLNLLGSREPKTYGRATLRDVERLCREAAGRHKFQLEFRQSNHEGEIVDLIHGAPQRHRHHQQCGDYTHHRSQFAIRLLASVSRVIEITSTTFSRARSFR
jgi:3-dehydroquinate dehydratase-2